MRERNNEASKRCRLKRRLKAESMESQANLLSMSNRLLKQRITRLEKIGAAFKEGVRRIQNKDCHCLQMVAGLKKISTESPDVAGISNASLIRNSRGYREQSGGGAAPAPFMNCATSSEDETMQMSSEESAPVSLPNRAELTITPVVGTGAAPALNLAHVPQPAIKVEPPSDSMSLSADQSIPITVVQQLKKQQEEEKRLKQQQQQQQQIVKISATSNGAKTALDVINDTIINSLKSPTVTTAAPPAKTAPPHLPPLVFANSVTPSTSAPLNLVKLVPAASLTRQQPPSPLILPHSPSVMSTPSPKHLILLSSPVAAPEANRKPSTSSSDCGDVVIKCEPEIQIVECDPPQTNIASPDASTCIAVARGASPAAGCRGELLNLNKLNTYLDLATKRATRDSGSAAMERAIIKSRLKIPFWKADEVRIYNHNFYLRIIMTRFFSFPGCQFHLRGSQTRDCERDPDDALLVVQQEESQEADFAAVTHDDHHLQVNQSYYKTSSKFL